jgi:hypothetical protein
VNIDPQSHPPQRLIALFVVSLALGPKGGSFTLGASRQLNGKPGTALDMSDPNRSKFGHIRSIARA